MNQDLTTDAKWKEIEERLKDHPCPSGAGIKTSECTGYTMKTQNPEEHPDESANDVCPVCAKDLTEDGECDEHGGATEWKQLAAESRASFRRAAYEDR